jgi:hypothetical protein
MDENAAAALNENLSRFALPQLSSHEQFRLADTIECVATVEKHRRSMDDNAARYLLFFRQHMLRRSQGVANKDRVSWREIVWAFHSGSQDILSDLVSRQYGGKMQWTAARESGIFMWLTDFNAIVSNLRLHRLRDEELTQNSGRNWSSSRAMNIPRRRTRTPLTVPCSISRSRRRIFYRVCGGWQVGTANKLPLNGYWQMTFKNLDGRLQL